jgi:hypothetical protein
VLPGAPPKRVDPETGRSIKEARAKRRRRFFVISAIPQGRHSAARLWYAPEFQITNRFFIISAAP